MTISFISIQENKDSSWDVVQKTFPKVSGKSITLSVTVSSLNNPCKDQKTAEIAAKKIAELNKLQYVTENTSVITITPFGGCFLPIELTPNGGVIGQGTNSPNYESAVKEGRSEAEGRKLPFISLK